MSFTENYLKLRQKREGTVQKSTGGVTLPVSSNALPNSTAPSYVRKSAVTPPNANSFPRSGLQNDVSPTQIPTLPGADVEQKDVPRDYGASSEKPTTSTNIKASVDTLNQEIQALKTEKKEKTGNRLKTGLTVAESRVLAKRYDEKIKVLQSERDALSAQYYTLENQEKQTSIQTDTSMLGKYTSTKDLQSDMEKVAYMMNAYYTGENGKTAQEYKSYLMEKYGLDENTFRYGPDWSVKGSTSLQQLYHVLSAQAESSKTALKEGGYNYDRMTGYEQMLKDAEAYKARTAELEQKTKGDPVGASIMSVIASPAQGADFARLFLGNLGHNDPGNPESYVPLNVYNMDATNFVSTVRNTVSQEIEENTDWEIFGQNVASFLYQTGMSVADSAVQVSTMGSAATLFMGASAASNQAKDIIERGGTNDQAFWGGLAAGAAETVFEKVSIDRLLSAKNITSIKSLLKETAKQAGVEASEETFTEIANILSDAVIMGDNSNFANAVSQYMLKGMTEAQAKRRAFLDCIGQVAWAGVGGALSGAAMGGAVGGFNYGASKFLPGSGLDAPVQTQQDAKPPVRPATGQNAVVQTQDAAGLNVAPAGVEGQNKTASTGKTESTAVNTDPAQHTAVEQTVIDAYQAAVDDNLVNFVETALENKGSNKGKYTLKPVSERAAADIKTLTGVDTSGFKTVLEQRIAEHIIDRHGVNGAADTSMSDINDVARMQFVLDHYDSMEDAGYTRAYTTNKANGRPGQAKTVKYIKAVNGTYYVVEAVPDTKAKTTFIVSAYMSNTKTGDSQTADANAPAWTAKTENANSPASDSTVPQQAQGVKNQSAPNSGGVFLPGSGLGMNQNQAVTAKELPMIERRAAAEPPVLTGGINNGEQLQTTGNRTADDTVTGGRTADSGKIEANLSDRGRGRLSGESSGGQAGVLADSTEGARRRAADQGRAAIERQNFAKTIRGEKVSSRSIGVRQGTDTQSLTVVPESAWDSGMQATAERVWYETGKEVTYVLGRIELEGGDGELHYVRGVYSENGIILQADNMRLSIDQIADHEIFHDKAAQSPGLLSQIEERIVERYGREELDKALDTYIRKLRGVIDMPENATQFAMDNALQAVLEEVFADAYAGINAFSARAERFNETVEQALNERGIGRGTQTDAATEQTTGPPEGEERYSVAETDNDAEREAYEEYLKEEKDAQAKAASLRQVLERVNNVDHQTQVLQTQGVEALLNEKKWADSLQHQLDRLEGETTRKASKRKTRKPVAESKPIIAKNDLRKNMMGLFSIPEGQKAELGKVVDQFADRLLKNGTLTEEDRSAFFDRMYQSGVVNIPADEYYQTGREIVKGGKVYVNEQVRAEFGDDWSEFRKRAFGAGVYLTGDQADSGVDVWNAEMSEMLPGHFQTDDTDSRDILERIVQIAEEGKDEKVSLAEYTAMLAEQEYIPEDELLSNMERQMDWALRTFAEKADLEIKLRDRTGVKIAQEREQRKKMAQRQRENQELRELQQKTLKQLQWLSRNRYRAPEQLKAAWNEVLGDIDIYAVNAADEMNWSKKHQATWRDLTEMYKDAEKNDPNFLRSAELERIVARLDNEKIGDMDIGALQDLYKAAVGIRTEFYNRNNVINDEMNRMFAEVYTDAKQEIEAAAGKYKGSIVDRFLNREQLTPMNMLERMGGWNPDGAFYSMARQLEKGERDSRDYTVRAKRQLQDFLEEHADWVKTADGQGKDAVWYELEVPELLELHMGDKPVFGKTITVYMTPAQKVHLYLESKSEDNLRHMMGGRTFVNKELYSKGKRSEALAQGTTVKLAPETVKKIVSDLTGEELALAQALDSYYNGFASERINKVSNALYGFDKAVSQNYAPIYTNQNYTKSALGVFDVTAEGVGNLKGRIQGARNPSYNISALDAFERHINQTARFVGMAIPARNWNTLLNWRERNNSMGDIITHKWGQEGKTYIEDLLVELQGGKTTEERSAAEKVMDTALSNYISSVFGFNPSIVFKQAMSFPLAGTYLGWENMPNIQKALATDDGVINTYTSELAYRLMGYSTPETAQLKDNPSKLNQNKTLNFVFQGGAITAMDGWTVKTIWRWAENAVKRTNPDLEVGTQEQINAGQSPFYRAVAKEFEEAVSRSQPMYDVMHRAQIMRSSNKAVRALTLFKTVPQQQYNMLRQAEGEAKYYKQQYQNGNATKEEYTQAKKKVGRAALGIIAAGLGIEAINFLNALLKNRAKRYRDDDGELTWTSGWRQFLEGFASDNLGMIIGGDLTVEILGSVILGDSWYGIETPGITQIEDVFEEFISGCQTIQDMVQNGYSVLANGGDLGEYFKRHGADYLGALDEALETVLTYFGGVAANNIKSYALGVLSWMSPQLATAYEDLLATADKSGLAGLTGEALETRVGDILKNRMGTAEDKTVAALAGLCEGGYKSAVPTDTPSKVTVDSEEHKLNAYQLQFYDTVWREAVGDSLDKLVNLDEFQGADSETQEKMLAKLYSYAAQKAKGALFEDFSESDWVGELDAALEGGESAAEWIAWEILTSGVSEKVMTALTDAGMSKTDALEAAKEYKAATEGLTADKDENGKTIPGSKKEKVVAEIDAMDITPGEKTALYYAAGYTESTLKDVPWYDEIMLPSVDISTRYGLPNLN